MNAIPVLNEIRHSLEALRERGETRTINIYNFPMTNDDAQFLDEALGRGPVQVRYDGRECTFWQETDVSGVWWGEYRNADGRIVLRTIEIAEFPPLAKAQVEDMGDGIQRIDELIAAQSNEVRRALPVLGAAAD
ncbi:MAG: hydrogenase expression/formation C-terminal domain-containing protein [Blastocatellia bacterium]|nr:hydrogenase expression/formation C-terminal domain-containing protein [Blastocatellia bacterium]